MNRNIQGWFSQGRIWIGLGAMATGLIVFAILSRQPNQWQSQAKLLIQLPQAPYNANADWSRAATTYAQLARGPNVLSAVIALTHVLETPDNLAAMVSVTLLPDTQLLAVVVTAGDATTAQNLADELARQVVIASRQLNANSDVDKLHTQIDTLNTQLDATRAEWQALETQMSANPSPSPATLIDLRTRRTDAIDRYLLIEANLASLSSQYVQITRGIAQLTVADSASTAAEIGIISPLLGGLLAALVGALAGFGFSLWIGNADVALRTPTIIQRAIDLPTVGALPLIRVRAGEEKLINRAEAVYAEPYRALAVGLGLSDNAPGWTVGVTSPAAAEGKTLTAANLAVTLAQSGRRTLLIDADLRTPMLHRLFKISNREGLTSMLHEFSLRVELQAAQVPAPDLPDDASSLDDIHSGVKRSDVAGLSLLTSGPLPARPEDVFGSTYLPRLIRVLADQYDVIVVDLPPVLTVNALGSLPATFDSTLLVIDAQRTRRRAARRAVKVLQQTEARVPGIALNRAKIRE